MAGESCVCSGGEAVTALRLGRGDRIVAVVPEHCNGPGWSNRVVWVHIYNRNGDRRVECLQIDDQSPEMHTLFDAGAAMHRALIGAVPVVMGDAE